MNKRVWFACIVISAIAYQLSSCKKDAQTQWDTEMLVPIVHSNLSLKNLVKDSMIKTGSDNNLILTQRSFLYEYNIADQVIDIPDTSISKNFKLNTLTIGNQIIQKYISLGSLAEGMKTSTNPLIRAYGQAIIDNHNGMMVMFPFSGYSGDVADFDASFFFKKATLEQGQIVIAINNYLPIDLQDIILEVSNKASGTIVFTDTIPLIAAGDSTYDTHDISGRTVESDFSVKLRNLSSPGSNGQPVPVDTANSIKFWVFLTNLKASEATAVFPSQDIVSNTEEVTLDLEDRQLTYVTASRGQLRVNLTNSVQQPITLTYTLEGAFDNAGQPLIDISKLPKATAGNPVTITKTYDLTGYSINLTGSSGTKFNTYLQTISGRIDSTGELAYISKEDSIIIEYHIENLAPNYVKGYLGQDEVSIIDTSSFSFLDMFQSGSIDLDDANVTLETENNLGVDGEFKINSMSATSPVNGTKTLTGSIVGQKLSVHRAQDNPLRPAIDRFLMNNSNSNIKDLIGILPKRIDYSVDVKTNVNGNTSQYNDFAYLQNGLKIFLNAEIPLNLIANDLHLFDTIGFDLSSVSANVAGIKDGTLNLIADNSYPLDAQLEMIIYTDSWQAVDTLLVDARIDGGVLDATCNVESSKKTRIPIAISEARMEKLKQGKFATVSAVFSTVSNNPGCAGQHLRIYSDHQLGITLSAKFNYKLGVKL